MPSPSAVLKEFSDVLRAKGLCEAVRVRNAATEYRFSAVYLFHGGTLHNICFVDKQDASVTHCEDLPVEESYCVFIKRTRNRFSLEHAIEDDRVEGHPKRETVQSYYGVPLMGESGHLLGTACHFDVEPIRLSADVVSLFDSVTPMLAEELIRPST
jgi:hypothetical protein